MVFCARPEVFVKEFQFSPLIRDKPANGEMHKISIVGTFYCFMEKNAGVTKCAHL